VALSDAERSARYRANKTAGKPSIRWRRPAVRRGRVARWQEAVETLTQLITEYDEWLANLPEPLAESRMAERLQEVTALRTLVDELATAELPRGFGRD
jgi:hypothetical protein